MICAGVRHVGYVVLSVTILVAIVANAGTRQTTLIGTWHFENETDGVGLVTAEVTFRANGTFEGIVLTNQRATWTASGTWVVAGKWLHYKYVTSDPPTVSAGATDRDEIIELTAKALHLRTSNGEVRTYHRR